MTIQLSAEDIRILQLLQHDCRLTNKEIADKLGRSATNVHDRVKRLEQEGYIKAYVALLDPTKIGKTLMSFTLVQLERHSQSALNSFKEKASALNEVMECYHMTGEYDFFLKIAVRDMNEYNDFLLNKLSTLSNIRTVQSYFVLSEGKQQTAYPLQVPEKPARK